MGYISQLSQVFYSALRNMFSRSETKTPSDMRKFAGADMRKFAGGFHAEMGMAYVKSPET